MMHHTAGGMSINMIQNGTNGNCGMAALSTSSLGPDVIQLIQELFATDHDLDLSYIELPSIRLLEEISHLEQKAAIREFVERFKKAKHKIKKSRPGYFRGVCQKYWKQNRERKKCELLRRANMEGEMSQKLFRNNHPRGRISKLIAESIELLFTPASGLETSIIDESIERRLTQLSDQQGIQALYEFCSAVMYRQERIRNMNAYLMNIITRQIEKSGNRGGRYSSHRNQRNNNNSSNDNRRTATTQTNNHNNNNNNNVNVSNNTNNANTNMTNNQNNSNNRVNINTYAQLNPHYTMNNQQTQYNTNKINAIHSMGGAMNQMNAMPQYNVNANANANANANPYHIHYMNATHDMRHTGYPHTPHIHPHAHTPQQPAAPSLYHNRSPTHSHSHSHNPNAYTLGNASSIPMSAYYNTIYTTTPSIGPLPAPGAPIPFPSTVISPHVYANTAHTHTHAQPYTAAYPTHSSSNPMTTHFVLTNPSIHIQGPNTNTNTNTNAVTNVTTNAAAAAPRKMNDKIQEKKALVRELVQLVDDVRSESTASDEEEDDNDNDAQQEEPTKTLPSFRSHRKSTKVSSYQKASSKASQVPKFSAVRASRKIPNEDNKPKTIQEMTNVNDNEEEHEEHEEHEEEEEDTGDDEDGMVFNEYDETNTEDANVNDDSDENSDDAGLVMLTDSMNDDKFDGMIDTDSDDEEEDEGNKPQKEEDEAEGEGAGADHDDDPSNDKYFNMDEDESDDSEDLPQQINASHAMKQQYLSASDGYVVMEKTLEKRNAHRLPFKARLQQIESQKKLKHKPKRSKKDTIHEIIKEKKREDKQQKTLRIIKILKELNKDGKIEDVADLNNVNNNHNAMRPSMPVPPDALQRRDDFNEEELKELTLIAQESVKHLPAKKPNTRDRDRDRIPSAKPTLSNSKSVGFPAFPPPNPQPGHSQYPPYASPFDPRPPPSYNGRPPPSHSHYYYPPPRREHHEHGHTLDNINETVQSNPNNDNKSHHSHSLQETQSHHSLNKMSEYKVEGLADSGPNCAVDHMQDRIRLRQLLRKQKSMGHSISETKSSAAANRRQLMLKTKAMKGKMRVDDEDKMLDNQLFHETAKLLKSDSDKRKHIKSKPANAEVRHIQADKPYISTESGAMPPLPPTPQTANDTNDNKNETEKMPTTRPMLRYYHSDGPPVPDQYSGNAYGHPNHPNHLSGPYGPPHQYYASHGHYAYYNTPPHASGHYPSYYNAPPDHPYHTNNAPPYPLPPTPAPGADNPNKSDHTENSNRSMKSSEVEKETEKEKQKEKENRDEQDSDPLLTYLGAFEPQTKQKRDKMKENETNNARKKPSLPLHQKSSPPDFLYPQPPKEGETKDASHAFASAFTASMNTHYRFPPSSSGPQHPPQRPVIDPYANSNPVNHRKVHIYAMPHRPRPSPRIFSPKSSESPQEPQAYQPLVDSCSCNVFCAGNEPNKAKRKKEKKKRIKREKETKIQNANSNENSVRSKDSKRSKGSGYDAIDNEWVCSDYEEVPTTTVPKNNSAYNSAYSSVENKMIEKSNGKMESIAHEDEHVIHNQERLQLPLRPPQQDDTPQMSLSRTSMKAPMPRFQTCEIQQQPQLESESESESESKPQLKPLQLEEPEAAIIPKPSEQIKLDLNRASVVKEEEYMDEIPCEGPKLMDRASKVIDNERAAAEDVYERPQMSSRHSAKVPPLQFDKPIVNKPLHKKKRKNRKNNKNHNAQYQNYNNMYTQPQPQPQPQPQQYVNYNQYPPQTPTTPTIAIPYLSSVPMVNAAATTPSGAPPLNRSTTAPSVTSGAASNTQLKQLENTVEQLRSHFVQLLQHLPLTTSQQQQFNSVHQISNLLSNANQNNNTTGNAAAAAAAAAATAAAATSYHPFASQQAAPAAANSVNSSYSTPNIGLSTVSANNLLNTNGANIIIQKQAPQTPNQYQVNPQNVQNMQTVQNMQNMMFCSNNTMNTSQPNMPNYAFPNIPTNQALSSIPLTITAPNNTLVTNPYNATATTPTITAANNAYLLQTNNMTMPNGFSSTPQAMQVGLYPNTTQQTPTSANNAFNLNYQ